MGRKVGQPIDLMAALKASLARLNELDYYAWRAADEACRGDSAQARLDAMADAEQLIDIHRHDPSLPINYDLYAAWIEGHAALNPFEDLDAVKRHATKAARAAFFAVPSLRDRSNR